MKIRLTPFKVGLLATAITLFSLTRCKNVYKPVSRDMLPEKSLVMLDSMKTEGQNTILSDSEYFHLTDDTLRINEDFHINPKAFTDEVDKNINGMFMEAYKINDKSELKYIDRKAVINGDKLFTNQYNNGVYVPIEYYAKLNPKVKPLLLDNGKGFFDSKTNDIYIDDRNAAKFKPMPQEYISKHKQEIIKKIQAHNPKPPKGKDYICLGRGMVRCDSRFEKEPEKFSQIAMYDKYNQQIQHGTEFAIDGSPEGAGANAVPAYVDYFIDKVAIITSNTVFTNNNKDVYIPVKFYARISPGAIEELMK